MKHATWVQKKLEILEKAGVIVRSVSPWASPIVIVPKRSFVSSCLRMDAILIFTIFSDTLSQLYSSFSSNLAVFLVVSSTVYIYAPKYTQIFTTYWITGGIFFVFGWVSDNQETAHICIHVFIILVYFTTYYFLVHF